MFRRFWSLVVVVGFGAMLAACGNTWEGVKEDSKSNAEAANEAIGDTVEKVEDVVK